MIESIDKCLEETAEECVVREGKADIIRLPFVFYNKVQEFNRDFSVLVINTYLKNELWKNNVKPNKWIRDQVTILDALSATGLRSIRYALECNQTALPLKIYANDVSKKAIETIEKNIQRNGVNDRVVVNREDAAIFMYKNRAISQRFAIIDLDPYGSASPFLDAAVQALAEGGLLMITCTDMAVLCGNHSETCHAKYGSVSLRSKSCHEMALRIIIRSVESHANRYGRYVVPLVCLSVDFYVRIFLQIYTSPNEVKRSAGKLSYVYQCTGCESIELQRLSVQKNSDNKDYNFVPTTPKVGPNCEHCGRTYRMGGPIWSDPIHSQQFISQLQKQLSDFNEQSFGTHKRIHGILQVLSEEVVDSPLYYSLDRLCRVVQCSMPSMKTFRSALLNGGFQVSYSHASKTSVKTNASNVYIWDIIRQIQKLRPKTNLSEKSAGFAIINKTVTNSISLETHENAEPVSKGMQLLRYQVNPEPNWGPQSLPSKSGDKRKQNQGKRSRTKDSDETQSANKKMLTNDC